MSRRMRHLAVLMTVAGVLAGVRPAGAQGGDGWTLQRLFDHARTHEPSIRAARLEIQAYEADVRQAALRANPRVEIERRQQPGGMDRQTMAMVSVPLELFRRAPRVATARADVAVATAMAEDRERMLLLDVHMAYSRYLGFIRRLSVLDQVLEQARRTLSLLEARASAGAIPRLERDQASVEVSRIEAARLSAGGSAEAALAELRRAVGLRAGTPLRVVHRLEEAIAWAAIDSALQDSSTETTLQERPDVRAAMAQVAIEKARGERARSEGRFDVSVFGGFMRMTSGFPQRAFGATGDVVPIEGTFNNLVAGAMIDLPLFNRNQGAVAAAELRASAAEQSVETRRLAVAAELDAARARLRGAVAGARVFTSQLRETARQNVDVVREAYSLGRNTLVEVVMEQQRYLEVEMAYTDALTELLDAHAAWQAARGRHQ